MLLVELQGKMYWVRLTLVEKDADGQYVNKHDLPVDEVSDWLEERDNESFTRGQLSMHPD